MIILEIFQNRKYILIINFHFFIKFYYNKKEIIITKIAL